jgi:hypothetical protein
MSSINAMTSSLFALITKKSMGFNDRHPEFTPPAVAVCPHYVT